MKKIPYEREEQQWLVEWLRYHPILKDLVIKIDNEGERTPLQGHRLKCLGLRPGASDLFIPYPSPSKAYCGLFLELKRAKTYSNSERLTPTWLAQEEFQDKVKRVGFAAHFCYGWQEGKRIIENYLLS